MISTAPPCTAGLDIGIVLDKSKSVKIHNLKKVIKFLEDLVEKFDPSPDADHFGLITFNENAYLKFDFADSKYHNKDALLDKIASEADHLEYQTRTDLALKMARDKLFTAAGGDRPDKPNIMFLFTDGKPTQPKTGKLIDFKEFFNDMAEDLKVSIIRVLAAANCFLQSSPAKRSYTFF